MRTVIVEESVIKWAKDQAHKRAAHTDNELFRGGHDREHRLMVGHIGQKIIYNQGRQNQKPIKLLLSDIEVSDFGDIQFPSPFGIADVKTAENKIRNQVHHPNNQTSIYIFCSLDNKSRPWRLHIWGWEYQKAIITPQYFVPVNELLPNEATIQRFSDGSYIYTGELKDEAEIIGAALPDKQGEFIR